MKKNKTEKYYVIAGLVILALGLAPLVYGFLFPPEGIGIIGGADAPTAIFLLGHAGKKRLILIAAGFVLLVRGLIGTAKNSR